MKFHHCLFKILKNQNVTDGQRENSIPANKHSFAGGGGDINNKDTDQTVLMSTLMCAFVVHIWHKQVFSWLAQVKCSLYILVNSLP